MRFFRFVIILLSESLRNHYHIYHHLAFLCQPIRPHPPAAGKHQAAGGVPTSQALHLSCCPISWPVTLLTLGL